MSKDKATPRPWHIEANSPIQIYGANGRNICDLGVLANQENQDNAELIVRAVNAHEALVDALEEQREWFEDYFGDMDTNTPSGEPEKAYRAVCAALNHAKGE